MRRLFVLLCVLMGCVFPVHAWFSFSSEADFWEHGRDLDEKTRLERAKLGLIERIDTPISKQPLTEYAVQALTELAQAGDSDAQWRLCTVYLYGRAEESGIMADEEKALHWCQQGANQGNARAQYWLSVVYGSRDKKTALYGNKLLSYDQEQTFYWLTRSAEQGDYLAQFALGLMYRGRLTYPAGYRGTLRAPGRLNLSEPERLVRKFKWTCLARDHAPSKSWLMMEMRRQCYGFSTEFMSTEDKQQMQQMIDEFKPKDDQSAKQIAETLVPEIYRVPSYLETASEKKPDTKPSAVKAESSLKTSAKAESKPAAPAKPSALPSGATGGAQRLLEDYRS